MYLHIAPHLEHSNILGHKQVQVLQEQLVQSLVLQVQSLVQLVLLQEQLVLQRG